MANTPSLFVFALRNARFWAGRSMVAAALALASTAQASVDTVRCPMADGFDHAVGKPNASGYYKFRGFSPKGHLGEDWNGNGGGNSDLGDPVYSIANGVVVHAKDIHVGWGNVVIVRHAYRDETGKVQMVDSLYGHLNEIKVKVGQIVKRGELVGTIGTNHGMYEAHLHLEMHKNLAMGPNRTGFAHDYSNYYSPTHFIESHRTLSGGFAKVEIPINTFSPYPESGKAGAIASKSTDAAASAGIRISAHSLSIPVYRGSSAPVASSYGPGSSSTKRSAPTPSQTPAGINPSAEGDDFWSRVKSKVKSGKITDSGSSR